MDWIDLAQDMDQKLGYEHSNKSSVCTEDKEFLGHLSNCLLPKNESDPWSWLTNMSITPVMFICQIVRICRIKNYLTDVD
jgi:hypothetical protein